MDFSHGNNGGSRFSATDNLFMIEKYTRLFATVRDVPPVIAALPKFE